MLLNELMIDEDLQCHVKQGHAEVKANDEKDPGIGKDAEAAYILLL